MLPTTTASRSKIKWPKPQDWDRKRDEISQLYDQHALKVVMKIMAERGFHATYVLELNLFILTPIDPSTEHACARLASLNGV